LISPVAIYPNPVLDSGGFHLLFTLHENVPWVHIKVITVAFRVVNTVDLGPTPYGQVDLVLPSTDKWGTPLANGMYHVVILTPQGRAFVHLLINR